MTTLIRYLLLFFYSIIASGIFLVIFFFLQRNVLERFNPKRFPLLRRALPYGLFTVAIILFCSFSFFNHYAFKSAAWDFGDYDQAVWKLSHFQVPLNTIIGVNNLGDHFELPLVYLSPLYWIWSSPYVLLLVQALALALAIFPLFYLALERLKSNIAAALMVGAYIFFFGIQSALRFDFHPLVLATPFLAWSLYFFFKKEYTKMLPFLFLSLITKENIAIYVAFFGLLIFLNGKKRLGLLISTFSLVYFIVVIKIIMPALANTAYIHFTYSNFGNDLPTIIKNTILNPRNVAMILLTPSVKITTLAIIFLSFALIPLFSPTTLILMAPLLLERFLSIKQALWTTEFHYSAPLAPFLVVGTITGIGNISKILRGWIKNINLETLAIWCSSVAFFASVFYSLWGEANSFPVWQFLKGELWPTKIDLTNINHNYQALSMISLDASVRAQDALLPHVSERERVYLIDKNYRSEEQFVILNPKESFWPMTQNELKNVILKYLQSPDYGLIYSTGTTILFEKGAEEGEKPSLEIMDYLNNP